MTVFLHELRQNRISLAVWTLVVSFMLCVTVFVYPEMESQMAELGDMFSDMGAFTSAFGMEELNFGKFSDYFAIECGNVLGLGGAFFAAILGIMSLVKEEKDKTGEFLLTHPVGRSRIVAEKLASVLVQLFVFTFITALFSYLCILVIGEELSLEKFLLLFFAYYLMQLVTACVVFGISAFLHSGGLGLGIGIAVIFYFINILSNLTEKLEFLRYLTPFAFADSGAILNDGSLPAEYLIPALIFALIGVAAAFLHYPKKDIS